MRLTLVVFLALGEPLIKGLTEVSQRRPEDPVGHLAEYLRNFSRAEDSKAPQVSTWTRTLKKHARIGVCSRGVSHCQSQPKIIWFIVTVKISRSIIAVRKGLGQRNVVESLASPVVSGRNVVSVPMKGRENSQVEGRAKLKIKYPRIIKLSLIHI